MTIDKEKTAQMGLKTNEPAIKIGAHPTGKEAAAADAGPIWLVLPEKAGGGRWAGARGALGWIIGSWLRPAGSESRWEQ